ncbi:MAG: PIN domain nuclease [Calditrichaeota bacterium]|nr:PIN domain-containing protein [Calditrichota bacterium]RQW08650.1 MAG: PIN domain nuclease [Calditrichota bacterium]
MKVLVDTCIWSLALRRRNKKSNSIVEKLDNLIDDVRVQLIGPIRQEILSGISSQQQFDKLKKYMRVFPDLVIGTDDYELAAEFYNICRKSGIQGSSTDFLICAISSNHKLPIFTVDDDFIHFKTKLPIELYSG